MLPRIIKPKLSGHAIFWCLLKICIFITFILGLEHTDVTEMTIMSPYYIKYDPNFKMQQDDIDGIQVIILILIVFNEVLNFILG